jgi:hypothetical protein
MAAAPNSIHSKEAPTVLQTQNYKQASSYPK